MPRDLPGHGDGPARHVVHVVCATPLKHKVMTIQQAFEVALRHHQSGLLSEAESLYRQILAIEPHHADSLNLLGAIAVQAGRHEEAIELIQRSIALKPDNPSAYDNLGVVLRKNGRSNEAITAYRHAIALQPNMAGTHYNLGNALYDKGRLDDAIVAYRQALALNPGSAEAHCNLGNALKDKGLLNDAIAAYRKAITLKPDYNHAHSNLLLSLHYQSGWDGETSMAEHRLWDRKHAEPLRQSIQPHANNREPERRLRIGYVSPDFRSHPVAFFFEGLLEEHDRAQVEVFCYADTPSPDNVTLRLRQHAGHWRETTGASDLEVADRIRGDKIDILIDLAGHTANNRLPVFARKPAPVQVTWLGYCDTTGLATIDYRITDAQADPPGSTEAMHSEQLVRLPHGFACFRPAEDAPPVGPLPALGDGRVTFASFHTLAKLNDAVLELWAQILAEVRESRLMLVSAGLDERSAQESLRNFFSSRGIGPGRLEFKGRQLLGEYLAQHNQVDMLLDCHPFSGHTVSCHALWMGVPVVTQAGRTHCSRMVASVLSNIGLPGLVAETPDEYVKRAVALALDLPRLAEMRSTLRERMRVSSLMDAAGFARDMEAAYREMWRKWCAQGGSVHA